VLKMRKALKPRVIIPVLILVLVVVLLLVLDFFLTHGTTHDEVEERITRPLCKHHQQLIYSALVRYREENGTVPPDLQTLPQQGYIEKEKEYILYCPARWINLTPYQYNPEHFGDPNKVLLYESVEMHGKANRRLRKLAPVTIQTMGDGRTIIQEITKSD